MDKSALYQQVTQLLRGLLEQPLNASGQMALTVDVLNRSFPYFDWVGFYIIKEPDLLEIGPYQGPLPCTRIKFGMGVCGTVAVNKETMIVEDVSKIDNYIACDSQTVSEIVVPVVENNTLQAVLDVDSNRRAAFDDFDQRGLEETVKLLSLNLCNA